MLNTYKIALIGLGSIGKRHLYNIYNVLTSRGLKFSIDLIRRDISHSINKSIENMISNTYYDIERVPNDYDAIFITNPTFMHYDTILNYSKKTKSMFIEKPLFDNTNYNLANLDLLGNGVYYVACPLRHTKVIQYIKKNIPVNDIFCARSICSSYLPDWRSGVDYRNTYSAKLEEGGGVSIDLIHEWDYITYLFGKPKNVKNIRGKFSNLEISSDDLSIYIAQYEQLLVEVHLDYFGRKPIREIQLFTKDDTIIADILNSEIKFLNSNRTIRFSEERNSYQLLEIEYFFDLLEGKCSNINNIDNAFTTLKIAKDGVL